MPDGGGNPYTCVALHCKVGTRDSEGVSTHRKGDTYELLKPFFRLLTTKRKKLNGNSNRLTR